MVTHKCSAATVLEYFRVTHSTRIGITGFMFLTASYKKVLLAR